MLVRVAALAFVGAVLTASNSVPHQHNLAHAGASVPHERVVISQGAAILLADSQQASLVPPQQDPLPPQTLPRSFDQLLRDAIARVPGADPGNWHIRDTGSWGATDLASGTVYIAPRTPPSLLLDVVRHEQMHVLQGKVYGDIRAARAALAPMGGIEVNADCGAIAMGATWSHYVRSCTPAQMAAASRVLAGQRA